jgi:hypothetical protein
VEKLFVTRMLENKGLPGVGISADKNERKFRCWEPLFLRSEKKYLLLKNG